MQIASRKFMFAGLLLALVGQTTLVYADTTADDCSALSEVALLGREVWHRENCQTCHQLYGFGGFLGPDLTNAAPRLNRARLDRILTEGAQQMPAFHLSQDEIDGVEAFLVELDQSGVGQARRYLEVPIADVIAMIDTHCGENPMTDSATRGYSMFRVHCSSCHTPFRSTPLGPYLAADLSTVAQRLDRAEIEATLVDGRPSRGMPPTGRNAAEREDLIAFLGWLGSEESTLRLRCDAERVDLGLPWFEYR